MNTLIHKNYKPEKIDEISNKFKEIRSLAIKYKEDKDAEIQKLHEELDSFKKQLKKIILYTINAW